MGLPTAGELQKRHDKEGVRVPDRIAEAFRVMQAHIVASGLTAGALGMTDEQWLAFSEEALDTLPLVVPGFFEYLATCVHKARGLPDPFNPAPRPVRPALRLVGAESPTPGVYVHPPAAQPPSEPGQIVGRIGPASGACTDDIVEQRLTEIRAAHAVGDTALASELETSLHIEVLTAIQCGHPAPARLAQQVLDQRVDVDDKAGAV